MSTTLVDRAGNISCVTMQVDKTGRAVKVNDDGFPDMDSLELETDQNQLRYEAYQHMAAQRAKGSPMGEDGSADTPPGRSHAWGQGQGQSSGSSSRTPFADSRPQTDRYTVALLGVTKLMTIWGYVMISGVV